MTSAGRGAGAPKRLGALLAEHDLCVEIAGCNAEQAEQAAAADSHVPSQASSEASETWELRFKMAELLVHVAKLSHVNGEAAEASAALVTCQAKIDEAKAKGEIPAEADAEGGTAQQEHMKRMAQLHEQTGHWQERSEKLFATLASAAWASAVCLLQAVAVRRVVFICLAPGAA